MQATMQAIQPPTQTSSSQGGAKLESVTLAQQPSSMLVTQGANSVPTKLETVTLTQQPNSMIVTQAHGTTGSGQQFIVTIAGSDQNGTGSQSQEQTIQVPQATNQTGYPTMYIEGGGENVIHTYPAEYGQSVYTPVSGTYYQTTAQYQVGGVPGQIIAPHGTYLVQSSGIDSDGHPLTHTTRASPATVQWLLENYETAEGVSLPRSTLYNHYLRHCEEQKLDPMNPASFGKLIRSVFIGLRTRRLGTRGNSKYHYYGIRIKPTSPLNQFTDDQTLALRQQPLNQGKRFKYNMGSKVDSESSEYKYNSSVSGGGDAAHHNQDQQFLGEVGALPDFDPIEMDMSTLPNGLTEDDVRCFEELYDEHCQNILEIIVNLQFNSIAQLWQQFWRHPDVADHTESQQLSQRLSVEKLTILSGLPAVQQFVKDSDYHFYQALVEVLIPDVLRPIPSSLTQAIRNFAKSLENWLRRAMDGVPQDMIKIKLTGVGAFAQTLRRYTSLNHLAQAARAVLQNSAQITQMLTDLNRVDFTNVQEQASWVCQCKDDLIHELEQDFKRTLQSQNTLEQWAAWLERVVTKVLSEHEKNPETFAKEARQFLLKWSFYSSMVIRDLTLRSAASFGSFHLIRLLYDEYMFYLIEQKVASATQETPIAVMGEVRQFMDLNSMVSLGSMENKDSPVSTGSSSTSSVTKSSTAGSNVNTVTVNSQNYPIIGQGKGTTVIVQSQAINAANSNVAKTVSSSATSMNANSGYPITLTQGKGGTMLVQQAGGAQQQLTGKAPIPVTLMSTSSSSGTKTIVVLPVSAAPTVSSSMLSSVSATSESPAAKRLKTEATHLGR